MKTKTLGSLAVRYVAGRRNTGEIVALTAAAERGVLRRFVAVVGDSPTLDRAAIDTWLATIRRLAPATRRTRFSIVKGFARWLVAEKVLRSDPTAGIRAPKVPRPSYRALESPDSIALLGACVDVTERLVVTLGLQLGLRRAEIAGLEIGDIAMTDGIVRIRMGKGGHHRIVPLTVECRCAIAAYLGSRACHAGPLVRGYLRPHEGVSPMWVGRLVSVVAYRAGVKQRPGDGVGCHSLRHTAASDIYLQSRDVLVVRDILGHSSLTSTQIYVRGLDVDRLREAMEGRTYRAGPLRSVA